MDHNALKQIFLNVCNKSDQGVKLCISLEDFSGIADTVTDFLDIVFKEYLRLNYLGPCVKRCSEKEDLDHTCENLAVKYLDLDGESSFSLAKDLYLLVLAQAALCHAEEIGRYQYHVYAAKLILLHQHILKEKSPTLRSQLTCLTEKEKLDFELFQTNINHSDFIEHILLMFDLCLSYYLYDDAKFYLNKSTDLLGIQVELSGASGVRTKYQQENKAQLFLTVIKQNINGNININVSDSDLCLPKDIALNDDTILPYIKFLSDDVALPNLTELEQACILCLCEHHKRTTASDNIVEEEMLAYVYAVLHSPKNWCIQSSGLLRRSLLEIKATRKCERAIQQLEELSHNIFADKPDIDQRQRLFFASSYPPIWKVEIDLANIFYNMNAINSALDIYLRWDQYSEIIACYQKLDKLSAAEKLIRQKLDEKETPDLYCSLAEVTHDVAYFHKAWELSNHMSARAVRSLGYIKMVQSDYVLAIEFFELSLGINYLQPKTWFTYGCCCMQHAVYEKAETAFRRCVNLDPDNAEAWSNLAAALLQLGKKEHAFVMLKEALRFKYENWKIWDNYIVVCADVGEFMEAVRAFHRLVDLKDKYFDKHVMDVLVRVVCDHIPDASGDATCHINLRPKVLELCGRLAAKGTVEIHFWLLYAQLSESEGLEGSEDKVLSCLQRALRCVHQQSGWEKEQGTCKSTLELVQRVADSFVRIGSSATALASARLTLRSILTRCASQLDDWPDIAAAVSQLEASVDKMAALQDSCTS